MHNISHILRLQESWGFDSHPGLLVRSLFGMGFFLGSPDITQQVIRPSHRVNWQFLI